MPKTVLLYNHDLTSLNAALAARGITVAAVQNTACLPEEVRRLQAELLICGCTQAPAPEFCTKLQSEAAGFPVLYVAQAESLKSLPKSPYHDFVEPGASPDLILNKIEQLLYFSEQRRELEAMLLYRDKVKAFSAMLSQLDFDSVIDSALCFFDGEFRCLNTVWFPEGAEEKEAESGKANRPGERPPSGKPQWRAYRDMSLSGGAVAFAQLFQAGILKTTDQSVVVTSGVAGGNDVVIAVRSPDSGKNFGHLILLGAQNWSEQTSSPWLAACLEIMGRQMGFAAAYGVAQNLNFKDDLTDLYNQRYLPVILEQELSRSQRGDSQFSVLFLDVDYFKSVNDTKGHLVGSSVLVELGKLLKRSIRNTDFAFRYGGDEYVMVLSGANSQRAVQVAERIRRSVENQVFNTHGTQVRVTVSIGIATFPEHASTVAQLMQMADEAMYYGKNRSRNIVHVAG